MDDIHPVAAEPAASPPAPWTSQEVVVAGNGVSLHGTLERPRAMPAMLLLQGSGPVNRDGNVPGALQTDLQKQIADALAEIGVATLRCDKRGEYANKDDMPQDKEAIEAFIAWDNLVDDAVAAWRFLCDQSDIDAERVGLFGHSEGGIVALAAAQQLLAAGETPAAVVLAATPGRPMGEVVRDQIERQMKDRGVKAGSAEQVLEAVDQIQETIADTGEVPNAVPAMLKPLYRPELASYWHSLLNLDPAELAKLFPGPVLVIDGTADKQVSARNDALTLSDALSERSSDDHDLLIVPRVTHELKSVTDSPTGDAAPIKPALINEISAWVKAKLVEQSSSPG